MIAFNFIISLFSVLVNLVAAKTRVPPIYFLFSGSIIQLIGISFLCTLPDDGSVPASIYGYEVLTGAGLGMVMGICLILPPHVVDVRDLGMSNLVSPKPKLHRGAERPSNVIYNFI